MKKPIKELDNELANPSHPTTNETPSHEGSWPFGYVVP
jgi:hypothetical protein